MRLPAALCLLALLGLPTPQAGAGSTLGASEVRALFPGRFEAVWKDKLTLTLDADAKGGLVGRFGIVSGSGRWWVQGSNLCIVFDRWDEDKGRCGRVVREGGWYHGLHRSSGVPRLRFRPI